LAIALGAGGLFAAVPVAFADTAEPADPSGSIAGPLSAPSATRGAPSHGSGAARRAVAGSSQRPAAAAATRRATGAARVALAVPSVPAATAGSVPAGSAPVASGPVPAPAAVVPGPAAAVPALGSTVAVARVATAAAAATAGGGFTLPVGPVQAAILAAQAYIYGYPLLAVQRVQSLLGPLNVMNINTSFASPDAAPFWKAIGGGSHPNVNVLYSLASLDLSNGPVVLSVPAMGDRYYSFQLTDPYINVDNYISSNPTAANPIGGPGPGTYAITWIGNNVDVPGAQKVLVNYSSELLLGRVEATTSDQQQVVNLMNQWTLNATGGTSSNNAVLPSAYLSPISVLNAMSTAMTQNPAYPAGLYAPELSRLARVGVGPDPSDPTTALQVQGALGPLSQFAAAVATQLTAMLLPPLTDFIQTLSAIQHQGWAVTKSNIGDFGTDYVYRAGVAFVGLVANTPDQALYYPGMLDSTYLPLSGNNSYLIHFAAGQTPPTDAGGFWSLTVYNSEGNLVTSTAPNVYSNGPLVTQADGSVDVVLAKQNPGDPNSNWLQLPDGRFSVYLRIYAPGESASGGTWVPPVIKRTSGLFG